MIKKYIFLVIPVSEKFSIRIRVDLGKRVYSQRNKVVSMLTIISTKLKPYSIQNSKIKLAICISLISQLIVCLKSNMRKKRKAKIQKGTCELPVHYNTWIHPGCSQGSVQLIGLSFCAVFIVCISTGSCAQFCLCFWIFRSLTFINQSMFYFITKCYL